MDWKKCVDGLKLTVNDNFKPQSDSDESDCSYEVGIKSHRNVTLFGIGAYLISKGISKKGITKAITYFNKADCYQPLAEDEIARLLKSLENYRTDWVEPLKLKEELPLAAILPIEALPEALHDFIFDCSERM